MGRDPEHLREALDSEPRHDASREAAFLRELAFCPGIEPPGAPLVQPGDTVGRFRIERLVGRGGMGVVYAAFDLTLERKVALKLLAGQRTQGEEHAPRLLREARATALVNHPNLATLFDIGEANGLVFIAMELVLGRTLRAVLETSAAPLADAAQIAGGMARALAAIHGAGLVHRDIKPENVMIATDGAVKVLDFGLAELGDVSGSATTPRSGEATRLVGRWAGTPSYMSPEQARGTSIDARSDVFSLGIVLYEMLAGVRPFRGATAADVLRAIVHDPTPPLPAASDRRLSRLFAVAERCLQKDPRNRYAHGGELATALEQVTTPATPPARRLLMVTGVAAVAIALVALVWRRQSPAAMPLVPGPGATSAPAASAAPARPGSMLDLPLPASTSAAAVTAYKSAIQSFHDSNWGQAELSLREALRLDPTLGVAYLRLSLIMSYLDYTAAEAKAAYRDAMRLRSTLSPRDHGLLLALEPLLNADPVDLRETEHRLTELTLRYPVDAELFNLLSIYRRWDGPEGQRQAAERALAIDAEYPDAWAALAEASVDRDEAATIAALDRCIELAPTASDCRMMRATVESALGRCEQAEQQIRRATDDPHASEYMFLLRARFLYALGEPREAVTEAFRQRWARLQTAAALEDSTYDSAVVAVAYGDFETAKGKAEEGLRIVDNDAVLRSHARFLLLLTEIEIESGRAGAAAAVASTYLKRRSAWQHGLPTEDPTVYLTRVAARGGALFEHEVRKRRESWYRGAIESVAEQRTLQRGVWRLAYVQGIEQKGEALEALAARPEGTRETVLDDALDASLGKALWLAGKGEEAFPYLARAHHRCDRLALILSAIRSDLIYGHALEKRGDRAGACTVYRSILHRWGDAKPRSVTADAARSRMATLACGAKAE